MARIPNIFDRDVSVKAVLAAVAVDPDVVKDVKALTLTGKRGRPKATINAKKVFSVLTAKKAVTGLSYLKQMVEAEA